MKTILLLILSCLAVFAEDTKEIHVTSYSYKIMPEDALATVEVFTRNGQTNMVRKTHTKDGVVLFRTHNFYYNGTEAGIYMFQTANGTNTVVGSTPGSPYFFNVGFDVSNKPRSAQIRGTNMVLLDWFLCTNGVFYPAESSLIQDANTKLPKSAPH